MNAIEIRGLSKSFKIGFFKSKTVLKALDLTVYDNEIFGYLGANGAGKTTTFKLMLGLLFPDKGSIEFWGNPSTAPDTRERIGYLPESPYFYAYLTAAESLDFSAAMYDIPVKLRKKRIDDMLALVNLERARNTPVRKFSRGMMQRLGIAQALIHDPKLLILDEPMSGLDPMGRKDMRDIILNCRANGTTILFSTHIISDVETICDRACIISNGELKETVTMDDMVSRQSKSWEIVYKGKPIPLDSYNAADDRIELNALPATDMHVLKTNSASNARKLMDFLVQEGIEVVSFNPLRQSLEEIYVLSAGSKDS